MKCEGVYLYHIGYYDEPIRGHVIVSEYHITDGYFIREGLSADRGWVVGGAEGVVNDSGYVWFKNCASDTEIKDVYRRWYEDKIKNMQKEIDHCEEQLKKLG